MDVEHDCAEDERGGEQDSFSVLRLTTQQRHLRTARLLHRNVLDLLDELHFVHLQAPRDVTTTAAAEKSC